MPISRRPELRRLAEQVARDVRQRSRFARRHAAELARAVLDALDASGAPVGPVAAAAALASPAVVRAALRLAEAATAAPEVVASMIAFAGKTAAA